MASRQEPSFGPREARESAKDSERNVRENGVNGRALGSREAHLEARPFARLGFGDDASAVRLGDGPDER